MAATFLWYDLETFGTDPRWDRIAQFAAIRTNADLEQVGDPVVLYGRITPDYVPDPDACLITGITPRATATDGLVEAELASEINALLSTPGTCTVGFNNIRFDDEFVRNLLYRNFYDPYKREYERGNSRWDILPLVRLAHDLRPEGIEWVYDDGKPVFRLEELSKANNLVHAHAHDALSDVEATRAVAQLVREKQRKLFDFYLGLRRKDEVRRIINLQHPQPILYNSPVFTRAEGTTSVVFPVAVNPNNENEIIAFDLRFEPDRLWQLDTDELKRLVFSSREELAGEERIPLVGVPVNKVPAVAPMSTIDQDTALRLGIALADVDRRAKQLASRLESDPQIITRVRDVYRGDGGPVYRDPDLNIYSGGFFGDEDRKIFTWIHMTPPEELLKNPPVFADSRGPEMLRRFVARNWPELLEDADRRRWHAHCAGRLLAPEYHKAMDFGKFRKKVQNLMARGDVPPRNKTVLRDLLDYAAWLERNILTEG